eukprot:1976799-Pyramimonas_sp.AAC.1
MTVDHRLGRAARSRDPETSCIEPGGGTNKVMHAQNENGHGPALTRTREDDGTTRSVPFGCPGPLRSA